MASYRIGVLALVLLSGMILLEIGKEGYVDAQACTRECDAEVAYMTCPSSGDDKISPVCVNCCSASVDCKLFRQDNSVKCIEVA
ncbi:hypothetical protein RDI58_026762 [Solanum bulbocastanum]|uniref:Trypsin proteinase inhibitor n=1 Tax=Solanum bulbocastanum TaxID=147425 RepID=A0AAN8T251_SOLBU